MTTPPQPDGAANARAGSRSVYHLVAIVIVAVVIGLLAGRYAGPLLERHVLSKEVVWSGVHADDPEAVQFSPDGSTVAYSHHTTTTRHRRFLSAAPRTISDGVELRWRSVGEGAAEQSVAIDSVDLGPDGEFAWRLAVRFRFSPNSQRLAAVCATSLIVVDVASGEHHDIEVGDRPFSDAAWLSDNEIVFITDSGFAWDFWRLRLDALPSSATRVHEEPYVSATVEPEPLPELRLGEMTGRFEFSPDGKAVLFRRVLSKEKRDVLLSLESGRVTELMDYRGSHSWKPDGSAVLVLGSNELADGTLETVMVLVDPRSGNIEDLTGSLGAFGEFIALRLTAPLWMPNGEHVLVRSVPPGGPVVPGGPEPAPTDHLVRVHPWEVVLSREDMLCPSTVAGTLLAAGESGVTWIDYDGQTVAALPADAPMWVWSPTGRHVAWIEDGEVIVSGTPPLQAGP